MDLDEIVGTSRKTLDAGVSDEVVYKNLREKGYTPKEAKNILEKSSPKRLKEIINKAYDKELAKQRTPPPVDPGLKTTRTGKKKGTGFTGPFDDDIYNYNTPDGIPKKTGTRSTSLATQGSQELSTVPPKDVPLARALSDETALVPKGKVKDDPDVIDVSSYTRNKPGMTERKYGYSPEGLGNTYKEGRTKLDDTDPFGDANLNDLPTDMDMRRGWEETVTSKEKLSPLEQQKLDTLSKDAMRKPGTSPGKDGQGLKVEDMTPEQRSNYSKWLLGGAAGAGAGIYALSGDDSSKDSEPKDSPKEPKEEPKETPDSKSIVTVKSTKGKAPTKTQIKTASNTVAKQVDQGLKKEGIPDFARKDLYTQLQKDAEAIYRDEMGSINTQELVANLIDGIANLYAGARGMSEGIAIGKIDVKKPDWNARRDQIRTIYKTALDSAVIAQEAEDDRVRQERLSYEREQDRKLRAGESEKGRKHATKLKLMDLAQRRAKMAQDAKLAREKATQKLSGKGKGIKQQLDLIDNELNAISQIYRGVPLDKVKGIASPEIVDLVGIIRDDKEKLKEEFNKRLQKREQLAGGESLVESPSRDPKISQYAAQYNLPYERAEKILKDRGYGQ